MFKLFGRGSRREPRSTSDHRSWRLDLAREHATIPWRNARYRDHDHAAALRSLIVFIAALAAEAAMRGYRGAMEASRAEATMR